MQEPAINPREPVCQSRFRYPILMNWKLWLAIAIVAAVAGAAFNWHWLVAAGLTPILLAVVPCLAMCALSLCACHGGQERTGGR
jgi:hypothetical protein